MKPFELRTHPVENPVQAYPWKPATWPKGTLVIWRERIYAALVKTSHQPPSNEWRCMTPDRPPSKPVDRKALVRERARREAERRARLHPPREAPPEPEYIGTRVRMFKHEVL
jgi:hypothetical protein